MDWSRVFSLFHCGKETTWITIVACFGWTMVCYVFTPCALMVSFGGSKRLLFRSNFLPRPANRIMPCRRSRVFSLFQSGQESTWITIAALLLVESYITVLAASKSKSLTGPLDQLIIFYVSHKSIHDSSLAVFWITFWRLLLISNPQLLLTFSFLFFLNIQINFSILTVGLPLDLKLNIPIIWT